MESSSCSSSSSSSSYSSCGSLVAILVVVVAQVRSSPWFPSSSSSSSWCCCGRRGSRGRRGRSGPSGGPPRPHPRRSSSCILPQLRGRHHVKRASGLTACHKINPALNPAKPCLKPGGIAKSSPGRHAAWRKGHTQLVPRLSVWIRCEYIDIGEK